MCLKVYLSVVAIILFNLQCMGSSSTFETSLGITEVNGTKYWIGNYLKLHFHEARRSCQLYGMDLISIKDEAKYNNVITLLQGSPDYFWTSGNKINDHRNWVWAKGEPMILTRWAKGEPNNKAKNEWCLGFGQGHLVDLCCDRSLYFICESVDSCENSSRLTPSGCSNDSTQQQQQQQQQLEEKISIPSCSQIQPVVYVTVNTNGNEADVSYNTSTAVKSSQCLNG